MPGKAFRFVVPAQVSGGRTQVGVHRIPVYVLFRHALWVTCLEAPLHTKAQRPRRQQLLVIFKLETGYIHSTGARLLGCQKSIVSRLLRVCVRAHLAPTKHKTFTKLRADASAHSLYTTHSYHEGEYTWFISASTVPMVICLKRSDISRRGIENRVGFRVV